MFVVCAGSGVLGEQRDEREEAGAGESAPRQALPRGPGGQRRSCRGLGLRAAGWTSAISRHQVSRGGPQTVLLRYWDFFLSDTKGEMRKGTVFLGMAPLLGSKESGRAPSQPGKRGGGLPGRGLPSRTDRRMDGRRDNIALRAVGSGRFLPSSDGTDGRAGCLASGPSLRLLLLPVVLWKVCHTRSPLCAGERVVPGDVPPSQWLAHAVSGHLKYIPHRNVCRILLLVAVI